MVCGDFNNALSSEDKRGGLPIPFSYLTSFNNCLLNCGLAPVSLQGCKFTWRKRGMATNIDKVLVNQELLFTCPDLLTIASPSSLSDHTMILIQFKNTTKLEKNAPFRYVNTWNTIRGYYDYVQTGLTATVWG